MRAKGCVVLAGLALLAWLAIAGVVVMAWLAVS